MNLSLPVSVISFSLEAFLMKALNVGRRKKVFSLRRHDFQQFCSWIPSVKSTTPLAIMLNSYESFRTIAYATFILHEKDDSIYFRFRNFIDIRMNGWYRGRVIFLCRILDIGAGRNFSGASCCCERIAVVVSEKRFRSVSGSGISVDRTAEGISGR